MILWVKDEVFADLEVIGENTLYTLALQHLKRKHTTQYTC